MVYRLHDAEGCVLYIGRSCNVEQRLRAHYSKLTHPHVPDDQKPLWLLEARRVSMVGPFPWDEACRVERAEIELHQPSGNRMHTKAHGFRPLSEGGGRYVQPLPQSAAAAHPRR